MFHLVKPLVNLTQIVICNQSLNIVNDIYIQAFGQAGQTCLKLDIT